MPERADEAGAVYEELLRDYPRNIYTAAVTAILAGRTPNLVDSEQEEAETAFDLALDFYPDAPDSLVTAMQNFLNSELSTCAKGIYRLGWFHNHRSAGYHLAREYLMSVAGCRRFGICTGCTQIL
jgi:tetratricopeptide (TPR) repeat protein